MTRRFDYDLAVVGGGSSGFAAAKAAADAGLNTAVLEGGKEVGGLCILRGCMPTKALLYAAEVAHLARIAPKFGVDSELRAIDFAALMARKARLIAEFADYRRKQLASGAFEFIRAQASFIDPHTLRLNDSHEISARWIILCTGSVVAPSPLPQLNDVGYWTSDDAVDLTRLPRSLIVLGGGPVACEFAQFFLRVGVKVTLIQRSEHILKEFDQDAACVLEDVFQREGMTVHTEARLLGARRDGVLKTVSFERQGRRQEVSADEILFALGRVANTGALRLGRCGVKTENSRIITNSEMQTTAPHIYAAGDCRGQHEIVHLAVRQAEIAVHNILHPGAERRMDYRLLASVIFTDPQLAQVGFNEKEAVTQSIPCLAARYSFRDHGKSLIMEALDGFVKLLADPYSGEIIGGAAVGPIGGELIHEIVAAMMKKMTAQELMCMPHYHPTLAEIWTYPAEELASKIQSR